MSECGILAQASGFLDAKELAFAKARLERVLQQEWLNETLIHPTIKPQRSVPPLKPEVLAKIPGAAAAMGDASNLNWQVCNLVGGKLEVQQQHVSSIRQGGRQYQNELDELLAMHTSKYENLLTRVPAIAGQPNNPEGTGGGLPFPPEIPLDDPVNAPELKVFDNEGAFESAATGILHKVSSAISGISILVGKDLSIALCSSKDEVIQQNTLLGGVGGTNVKPRDESVNEGVVDFCFPEGDRCLSSKGPCWLTPLNSTGLMFDV